MDNFNKNIDQLEINVAEKLRPSLERKLTGSTATDIAIASQKIPEKPRSIRLVVKLIRLYRKYRPSSIGNRCVYEPSCSHYSEVVFKKYGIFKGFLETVKRIFRCRPGHGGLDLP